MVVESQEEGELGYFYKDENKIKMVAQCRYLLSSLMAYIRAIISKLMSLNDEYNTYTSHSA